MAKSRVRSFVSKYRDYIRFNKNMIISGTASFFATALIAQLYSLYDSNSFANSVVALLAEYGVYIPIFAFLFYRDNRHKYIDPITGKRNSKRLRTDIKKLFAAFSASEVIYAVTRIFVHYQFLGGGAEAYQASMAASLIATCVFFICINVGVKLTKLFR